MMTRILVSENFFLDEFVDPCTYFLTPSGGKNIIDPKIISCVQLLRKIYGKPIGVNNWWKMALKLNAAGKTYAEIVDAIEKAETVAKWSGIRTPRCPVGAPESAHRLFKAADPKGPDEEFFEIVRSNSQQFYDLGLRRLENPAITFNWLHMDTHELNTKPGLIRVVNRNTHAFDIRVSDNKIVNIKNPNGFKVGAHAA